MTTLDNVQSNIGLHCNKNVTPQQVIELLTENDAFVSAKHNVAKSYWGARGLRVGWVKVLYMFRLSTKNYSPKKQQEACAILWERCFALFWKLRHFLLTALALEDWGMWIADQGQFTSWVTFSHFPVLSDDAIK